MWRRQIQGRNENEMSQGLELDQISSYRIAQFSCEIPF